MTQKFEETSEQVGQRGETAGKWILFKEKIQAVTEEVAGRRKKEK